MLRSVAGCISYAYTGMEQMGLWRGSSRCSLAGTSRSKRHFQMAFFELSLLTAKRYEYSVRFESCVRTSSARNEIDLGRCTRYVTLYVTWSRPKFLPKLTVMSLSLFLACWKILSDSSGCTCSDSLKAFLSSDWSRQAVIFEPHTYNTM